MFIKVVELWWCYGGAGPVSPRTLNAACLRVKVESIKILAARPALN